MNIVYPIGCHFQRGVIIRRDKSLEPVSETIHFFYVIMVMQAHNDRSNDIVQSGTETAAGYDTAIYHLWIEEDLLTRTSHLKSRRLFTFNQIGLQVPHRARTEHHFIVSSKPDALHRRVDRACSQPVYGKIFYAHYMSQFLLYKKINIDRLLVYPCQPFLIGFGQLPKR